MEFIFLWTIFVFAIFSHVSGQCSPNRTATVVVDPTTPGYISSPDYPSPYPANSNCSWLLINSPSGYLVINIEVLDIEGPGCVNDKLTITDGDNEIGTVCNSNWDIFVHVTNESTLSIQFESDGGINSFNGFRILYFFASQFPSSQYACDSNVDVSVGEEVMMLTPNFPSGTPYSGFHACTWTVTAPIGYILTFTFKFMDIENCAADKINFYDGISTSYSLLGTSQCYEKDQYYSGGFTDIVTTGNAANVSFEPDSDSGDYAYGFMMTVTAVVSSGCDETLVSDIETFKTYSNFEDDNSEYRNLRCEILIHSATDTGIEISFYSFDMEYDTYCQYDSLSIYDGSNTDATLLGSYCGVLSGTTIRSSSNAMFLLIVTDASIRSTALSLDYVSFNNSNALCSDAYTEYPATAVPQQFTNANQPYTSNTDEYWLVTNDPLQGDLILNLIELNIEKASDCIYDRITIYNGSCTKDAVLDTHCGTYLKRWELTGTQYLIHFHTDGSVEKDGFTMQYFTGTANTGAPTTTTTTFGPPLSAEINLVNEVLVNYSISNIPVRDLNVPVEVTVDLMLIGVNDLDEVSQKLTTTILFNVVWSDENLIWPTTKQAGISQILMPQNDIWKPDVALMNSFTKITPMGASFMFVVVTSAGQCTWRPYQILESTCSIDMSNYPYDTQSCDIQISTWSTSTDQVKTIIGQNGMEKHSSFVENSEWHLLTITHKSETISGQETVTFTLTLQRNEAFVMFNIAGPIIMLSFLNVLTFALPAASGEKASYAMTIFLSFIVYVVVLVQKLPASSDTISYFAMYVLAVTCLSQLTVMLSVLELRFNELKTKHKPVVACTRSFTKCIISIQTRLLCIKTLSDIKRYQAEEERAKRGTHRNDDDDDDADDDNNEDNAWEEFVSALDFVLFWVFLSVTLPMSVAMLIYLSNQ